MKIGIITIHKSLNYRVITNNPYSQKNFFPNPDVKKFYEAYRDKGFRYAYDSFKDNKKNRKEVTIHLFRKLFNQLFKSK